MPTFDEQQQDRSARAWARLEAHLHGRPPEEERKERYFVAQEILGYANKYSVNRAMDERVTLSQERLDRLEQFLDEEQAPDRVLVCDEGEPARPGPHPAGAPLDEALHMSLDLLLRTLETLKDQAPLRLWHPHLIEVYVSAQAAQRTLTKETVLPGAAQGREQGQEGAA